MRDRRRSAQSAWTRCELWRCRGQSHCRAGQRASDQRARQHRSRHCRARYHILPKQYSPAHVWFLLPVGGRRGGTHAGGPDQIVTVILYNSGHEVRAAAEPPFARVVGALGDRSEGPEAARVCTRHGGLRQFGATGARAARPQRPRFPRGKPLRTRADPQVRARARARAVRARDGRDRAHGVPCESRCRVRRFRSVPPDAVPGARPGRRRLRARSSSRGAPTAPRSHPPRALLRRAGRYHGRGRGPAKGTSHRDRARARA